MRAAGRSPRLILGDGVVGALGERFDRLHVTCGVRDIPLAWIAQLRPGGVAVLPWHPNGMDGWQVRLTAAGDGTATGTFHGMAGYMMLRSQRLSSILWRSHHGDQADVSTTTLDPAQIAEADRAAALALTAANPDLTCIAGRDSDGAAYVHVAETSNAEGSWAACDVGPPGRHIVTQYGPRRLWNETKAAFAQWDAIGRPGPAHYRHPNRTAGTASGMSAGSCSAGWLARANGQVYTTPRAGCRNSAVALLVEAARGSFFVKGLRAGHPGVVTQGREALINPTPSRSRPGYSGTLLSAGTCSASTSSAGGTPTRPAEGHRRHVPTRATRLSR